MTPIEDYRAVVERLQKQREWKDDDVAFYSRSKGGTVSQSLIQKRLAPGSTARPSQELLKSLALAFDEPPEIFVEYRLAEARRLLDEYEVGLDQALANLQASGLTGAAEPAPAAATHANALPGMPVTRPGALPDPERSAPTQKPKRTAQGTKGDRSRDRRRDVA